ncbi:ABC transporter ATP-binding protein [Erysipelotrichaceae bacterium]|nr:ABC transporter ATP-binding protein [Erysipelotrichaceae bacterium]
MNFYQTKDKLVLEDVMFSYDTQKLFENFSIEFPNNQCSVILGPSGCGKSTLFHLMAGLLSTGTDTRIEIKQDDIALMQQEDALLPWLKAVENIMLPFKLYPNAVLENKIKELIKKFGLTEYMALFPHELSGGIRKRVALLRTYALERKIVLLDEPFASLDYFTRHSLYQWLQKLQQELPHTTIIITHDFDEALILGEVIYLLNKPVHTHVKSIENHQKLPKTSRYLLTDIGISLKKELIAFFE